jgi:hypothetical protein
LVGFESFERCENLIRRSWLFMAGHAHISKNGTNRTHSNSKGRRVTIQKFVSQTQNKSDAALLARLDQFLTGNNSLHAKGTGFL